MGFFAEMASEARRGMVQAPAPAQRAATEPPPPAPEPNPEPHTAVPETAAAQPAPEPPVIDLTPDANAADDTQRRKAHETAESKRKAKFDVRQAEKKAARQAELDRIAAMTDEAAAADAVKRVGADTEKLTRRNMKEAVCEHIQAVCRKDAAFARRIMDPEKSMIHCFQYINRKAREYAEQEMEDLGIQRSGVYGCDVPDGLCYQWAEDYFNDPNAKEDHKDDEKFVPKPYVPAARKKGQGKGAQKLSGTAKSGTGKVPAAPGEGMEQISLM